MKRRNLPIFSCSIILALILVPGLFFGVTLKFVIIASQDSRIEMPKYKALAEYLKLKIPEIEYINLQIASDYPNAVELFKSGKADGMISGSFVAAVLIKKDLAVPVVRPVSTKGFSSYKAIIVAKKGTKKFKGIEDFKDKKVAYIELASAGEVFVRSLLAGKSPESLFIPVLVKKHQIAVNAVKACEADYGVVKDLIFDPAIYPGIEIVGEDSGAEVNPNDAIILNNQTYKTLGPKIESSLLSLEKDTSETAVNLKKIFDINGYIKTTPESYTHTYGLMKKALIDPKKFNFNF